MQQRIREICGDDPSLQLEGKVGVDETYIGGKERNKEREARNCELDAVPVGKATALRLRGRGGKVSARHIQDISGGTLKGEIYRKVKRGSTVYTDDHWGYLGMNGYDHQSVNHSAKQFVDGMASTNGIERLWAVFERMHYRTHHHFSVKHLPRYVNECAQRMNEGHVENHMLERMDFLFRKSTGHRIAYRRLKRG